MKFVKRRGAWDRAMSLPPTQSCFCKQPTANSPYSPLTVPAVFSVFMSQSPAQNIRLWWAWKITWGRSSIVTSRTLGNSTNLNVYCNKNILCADHSRNEIQGTAERTPLFGKLINSKPKKIRQIIFYFRKVHRMPFYINVFWTKHHSSGDLEYW